MTNTKNKDVMQPRCRVKDLRRVAQSTKEKYKSEERDRENQIENKIECRMKFVECVCVNIFIACKWQPPVTSEMGERKG